jgi:hypothetical protein
LGKVTALKRNEKSLGYEKEGINEISNKLRDNSSELRSAQQIYGLNGPDSVLGRGQERPIRHLFIRIAFKQYRWVKAAGA